MVFYYKMKGDYLRYRAEVHSEDGSARNANLAYVQAKRAAKGLKATNPINLGLALNYSVFFYEILSQPQQACELAKQAFDAAVTELDQLDSSEYKDATLIMQLLRDNLTLWSAEDTDRDGDLRGS